MTVLDKAIELLKQNYDEAQKTEWVISPIEYALYKTWRTFLEIKRREMEE